MKHLKMSGHLAIATIALIAFVATSANAETVFCTVQESPCPEANRWAAGTSIDFSIASGNSALLVDTSGNTLDTCKISTAKGKLENAEKVTIPVETLTWGTCTFTTNTLKASRLEVKKIAGTHNGTVFAGGTFEVTIASILGDCIYGVTAGTSLGDLTEGKPAIFHANAVVEETSAKAACPDTAIWTATYTLTEPSEKTLSVEEAPSLGPTVFCTVQESPCPEANGWAAGTTLDLSLKSGTSAQLTNTAGTEVLDTCTESTAKGKLTKADESTGSLESLTWSGCTFPTTTTLAGKWEVKKIVGTHNGTFTADSTTEFTINGGFFGSCLYGASPGTDLGELKEGKPATLTVSAVVTKQAGSAAACPETAKWTAEYMVTEPAEKTLSVERGPASFFCTVQESPCPEANRWAAGTSIDFSIASGNSALLVDTSGNTLDTCKISTAKGKLENAEKVTIPVETLTWGTCTFTTNTLKASRLEVKKIAGTHNGTVFAGGTFEVTIASILGDCIYGVTAGTSLGDLTEGKPAIFHANAVVEETSKLAACPDTTKWTGTYTLTEPSEKTLSVETS